MKYDIGVNCEPNGHGTISYDFDVLEDALDGNKSIEAKKLKALLQIANMAVGDSIANMLLIECILYDLDMSIQDLA